MATSINGSKLVRIANITSRRLLPQPKPKQASISKRSQKENPKDDETPWPRSLRIAGYTFAILSVPASIGACIVEQPEFRSRLEGDGENEQSNSWGEQAVCALREYWAEPEADPDGEGVKSFKNDLTASERAVARCVGRRNRSDFLVRVSCNDMDKEVIMAGNVKAVKEEVIRTGEFTNAVTDVTLEFIDDDDDGDGDGNDDTKLMNDYNISDSIGELNPVPKKGQELRHMTHTYSTWHHHKLNPFINTGGTSASVTDDDIRRMELEWNEKQLMNDLNDPNCSKDLDDAETELANIRRELRKYKGWKRWIGL